jgi:hypothetical protein
MRERIAVDPDFVACTRVDRRASLAYLVGQEARVRVTNPLKGNTWEGVLRGLADHPTLLLQLDSGHIRCLPQDFSVEEIEPLPEAEPEPSIDIRGEIQSAIEDIDAGRPDTARQILAALLNTLDKPEASDG